MLVRGVRSLNAGGVVVHVDGTLGHPDGREACGSRRSYRNAHERERKNEVSQGAKQPHGGKANDASRPLQLIGGCIGMCTVLPRPASRPVRGRTGKRRVRLSSGHIGSMGRAGGYGTALRADRVLNGNAQATARASYPLQPQRSKAYAGVVGLTS
jgi:hypothetical protein